MTHLFNSKKLLKDFKRIYKKKNNPLHAPSFDNSDLKSMTTCLKSTYVSTYGSKTMEFERQISKFTGSKYVVCTSSGTAAIHVSLLLAGVKMNEEVILPSFNFVASANAITYCNAIPHFIDVDEESLSIEPNYLEKYLQKQRRKFNFTFNRKTGRKIGALILPHLFGFAADSKKILKVLKKYNIKLIEDAAEGLGVYIKNYHVGTVGKFGILSFNGNKIITTGGGGAILTQNYKDYIKAKKLVSTNKIDHQWKYNYSGVGFNYRMPSINASLGISQLQKIDKLIKKKENNFKLINKYFKKHEFIKVKSPPKLIKSNYWLINLVFQKKINFNKLLSQLNNNGIQARRAWCLIHNLKHFKKSPKSDLKNSIKLFNKIISIPSSSNI